MFGSSKNGNNNISKSYNEGFGSSHNNIGYGTKIKGEITCDGDIRIDGHVKGSVSSKAKIVIGESGMIEGDVVCTNAVIAGQVTGTITVNELLTLQSTAVVDGDIIAGKFVVEEGAKFNGKCQMGEGMMQERDIEEQVNEKELQFQEQE